MYSWSSWSSSLQHPAAYHLEQHPEARHPWSSWSYNASTWCIPSIYLLHVIIHDLPDHTMYPPDTYIDTWSKHPTWCIYQNTYTHIMIQLIISKQKPEHHPDAHHPALTSTAMWRIPLPTCLEWLQQMCPSLLPRSILDLKHAKSLSEVLELHPG